MSPVTRRDLLALGVRAGLGVALGTAAQALAACRPREGPLDTLVIQAPPSPPSLALLRVAAGPVPAELARAARFDVWSTVDEMRARITSNQAHLSGMPTNVAATLYNRGLHVQLLNVYIWGIVYLVTADPSVSTLEDLRGQSVLIPFRGDLPDILTQYLLRRRGLELGADVAPTYVSAAPEAAQLLAAGRAVHAVLSEPSATLAILKARESGVSLRRAVDYAQAWATATGRPPRLPLAGVVAAPSLVTRHPRLLPWFQGAFREAVGWVTTHPEEASRLGAAAIKAIPPAVMQASVPYIQFSFAEAREAREELEFFLGEMRSLSPDLIGGQLPPDGFYYQARS